MNKLKTLAFSIVCRNEDIFEFTQEYGLHGVAIYNRENPYENWLNPKLMHSLGYAETGVLSWERILSPEDYLQKEKRYIHKNGGDVHIILSVSVVKDVDSNPVYTIGQMTNISELKLAQQEIDRILKITKDQNHRLKNF